MQYAVNMMEKRREKFIELAEKRVTRSLKDLRLIGNLANKSNYSYTDDDVKKIMQAIEHEVRNLRRRFDNSSEETGVVFKLK